MAVIFFLGAAHGLILALVLSRKQVNKLPNQLLALLMIAFSVDLGMAALQSFGILEHYPQLIGLDYPVTLLYGPLLYLYVKTMKEGHKSLQKIDYLHFLPFLVLLIYLLPFYFGSATDKLALLRGNIQQVQSTYGLDFITSLKVTHGLLYVAGVVYMLISYRRRLKDSYSSIERINLNWLQHFITGAALLAIIAGGVYFLNFANNTVVGSSGGIYVDITLLAVTGFVFGIGYMGLHQPEVFSDTVQEARLETGTINWEVEAMEKYQKSGLEEEQAVHLQRQLITLMETQKLYRDSDLKLADLAENLEITPHNLTEVINRYIGQNFYDFINSYRVDEVKSRLRNSDYEEKTLLAVALDAGFNSKSTFNAVFKKQTGMTPSQYRRKKSEDNT